MRKAAVDNHGIQVAPVKPRVLVVDDEYEIRLLIERLFAQEFEVLGASNGEEGLHLAESFAPNVVISDQMMPGILGVEFLERIRQKMPDAIRILITAFSDYGALVEAVNSASIHYYIEKPFQNAKLRLLVDGLVREQSFVRERRDLLEQLAQAVTSLEEANQRLALQQSQLQATVEHRTAALSKANLELRVAHAELQETAIRDGLTGLYNRLYLLEFIAAEIARSRRYKRQFSLLFLDIDHFKTINDRFGHQVGDKALIALASLLLPDGEQLRKSDCSARYGGEEFVVVLPETSGSGAVIKAEAIRAAIEGAEWSHASDEIDGLTVSIGIAVYPKDGTTVDKILLRADERLYQAKEAGRNTVVFEGTSGTEEEAP